MTQCKLRVLAETAYPISAGGPRVRIAEFARFLEPLGVSLDYRPSQTVDEYAVITSDAPPWRKAAALMRGAVRASKLEDDHDLRLVHRLRTLLGLPGSEQPKTLDVYDFDDALFLGSLSPANARYGWLKREARRCVSSMKAAKLVIAGNDYLADAALRHSRRVEVVPSCVDIEAQPEQVHRDEEVLTVGWIGSPSTSPYLLPVLPAIERLNRDGLRARLLLVGADRSIEGSSIEHRPWTLERAARDVAEMDIGIMPLPDAPWERGKCGYKLLQYFAAGVPGISSPVGINTSLIGTDRGLLATSVEEWVAALERLAGDPDLRRGMGEAARGYAAREYSYERWAPELAAMLASV